MVTKDEPLRQLTCHLKFFVWERGSNLAALPFAFSFGIVIDKWTNGNHAYCPIHKLHDNDSEKLKEKAGSLSLELLVSRQSSLLPSDRRVTAATLGSLSFCAGF